MNAIELNTECEQFLGCLLTSIYGQKPEAQQSMLEMILVHCYVAGTKKVNENTGEDVRNFINGMIVGWKKLVEASQNDVENKNEKNN